MAPATPKLLTPGKDPWFSLCGRLGGSQVYEEDKICCPHWVSNLKPPSALQTIVSAVLFCPLSLLLQWTCNLQLTVGFYEMYSVPQWRLVQAEELLLMIFIGNVQ